MRQFTEEQKREIYHTALHKANKVALQLDQLMQKPNNYSVFDFIKKKNTTWIKEKTKNLNTYFFIAEAVNAIYCPPLKFHVSSVPDYFIGIKDITLDQKGTLQKYMEKLLMYGIV